MMTTLAQYDLWLHAAGLLACGSTLFVLAAWFFSRRARSGSTKRMAWQTALAGVVLLVGFEFTGTGQVVLKLMQSFQTDGTSGPESPDTAAPPRTENPVAAVPNIARVPELLADALVIERTNESDIRVRFADVQTVAVQPLDALSSVAAPSTPSPASNESTKKSERPAALTTLPAERETSVRGSGWSWAHWASPVLGFLWLSVAMVLAVRYCFGRIRVARLQRRFQTINDEQRYAKVAGLARQLGVRRRVRLVESEHLSGPVTYGIVRPTIALPVDFSKRFGRSQQEAVLAHELSHIASRDAAWQLTADGVACLLWWQPLVWWLRRQFRSTCESAADEASLLLPDGPGVLAKCLVALGRQQAVSPSTAWLWVAGRKSNLTERVESLLRLTQRASRPQRIVAGRLLRVFVLIVMTVVTVTGATWLHPSEAFAEKDTTMKSMWKQSLAGVTLMAVLGTVAGTLQAQEEEGDVETAISIDIRHEIERDIHEDEDSVCKVEWNGEWYDATVLKKKKDSWYIHYNDDDDSYDEWVGKDRIRFQTDGGKKRDLHFESKLVGGVGSDCTVEWEGEWYDAKVLKKKKDSWYIHYNDDDESYDEWVGKDRIRFQTDGGEKRELHEDHGLGMLPKSEMIKRMLVVFKDREGQELLELLDLRIEDLDKIVGDLHIDLNLDQLKELDLSVDSEVTKAVEQAMHQVRKQMMQLRGDPVVDLVVDHQMEARDGRERIQHLNAAIASLRAGGFEEAANELQQRMKELIEERLSVHEVRKHVSHDHEDLDVGEGHEIDRVEVDIEVDGTDREMDELRDQLNMLRAELAEMRRLLEESDPR